MIGVCGGRPTGVDVSVFYRPKTILAHFAWLNVLMLLARDRNSILSNSGCLLLAFARYVCICVTNSVVL